jgi:hypothetical protein
MPPGVGAALPPAGADQVDGADLREREVAPERLGREVHGNQVARGHGH